MSTQPNNPDAVHVPPRLDLAKHSGPAYRTMLELNREVEKLGLEKSLLELIKIRASQVNGCAYCIDMHTIDAEALGESPQRIYALNAWRETPFFTARERAALAFTESATLIADGGVDDAVYDEAAKHFSEAELTGLIWMAAVINTWNRIAIPARATPGQYQPGQHA